MTIDQTQPCVGAWENMTSQLSKAYSSNVILSSIQLCSKEERRVLLELLTTRSSFPEYAIRSRKEWVCRRSSP